MDNSRTIAELKTSFIRSQIRTLSAALEPSEDWRRYGAVPEEGDISDKAVEEVLQKCMSMFLLARYASEELILGRFWLLKHGNSKYEIQAT